MRDFLTDVIRHIGNVDTLKVAKIDSNDKRTKLEAMDENRSVILHAEATKPCLELQGVFGITKFDLLRGFLSFPNYKGDDATIEVKNRDLPTGETAPEELIFSDGKGQTAAFRFMAAEYIVEPGKFLGTHWDVRLTPSRSKLQEFLYLAGIMQQHEGHFIPAVIDNNLVFFIGDKDASTDRVAVTIASDVTGKTSDSMYYDLKNIVPIMKLGLEENLELAVSARGALMLKMNSANVTYSYFFPGRIR